MVISAKFFSTIIRNLDPHDVEEEDAAATMAAAMWEDAGKIQKLAKEIKALLAEGPNETPHDFQDGGWT